MSDSVYPVTGVIGVGADSWEAAAGNAVDQPAAYPMQLMLGIYEFRCPERTNPSDRYPKMFGIDYVRGYRLTST